MKTVISVPAALLQSNGPVALTADAVVLFPLHPVNMIAATNADIKPKVKIFLAIFNPPKKHSPFKYRLTVP